MEMGSVMKTSVVEMGLVMVVEETEMESGMAMAMAMGMARVRHQSSRCLGRTARSFLLIRKNRPALSVVH